MTQLGMGGLDDTVSNNSGFANLEGDGCLAAIGNVGVGCTLKSGTSPRGFSGNTRATRIGPTGGVAGTTDGAVMVSIPAGAAQLKSS
jgi:hypothetical protein